MATFIDLPQPLFSSREFITTSQKENGHIGPLLYAAIGVILGVISGVTAAWITEPTAVVASVQSVQAVQTDSIAPAGNRLIANAAPTQYPQSAPSIQPVSLSSQTTAHFAPKPAQPSHATQVTASISKPVVVPSGKSVQLAQPLSIEQDPIIHNGLRQSSFYVEGNLKVVDFDAKAGTIETVDGKWFAVDAAGLNNLASRGDEQINMFYRCGQGGSCVLKIPGSASFNARMI